MLRRVHVPMAMVVAILVGLAPAMAQSQKPAKLPEKPPLPQPKPQSLQAKPAAPAIATPAAPSDSRPYDGQLIRLAEILGALSYLGALCEDKDAATWRQRMQALLDTEGSPPVRKDRLAGAYNRGVEGYSLSYRTCTPNAHLAIERFLAEGARIAKDVENRYRAS